MTHHIVTERTTVVCGIVGKGNRMMFISLSKFLEEAARNRSLVGKSLVLLLLSGHIILAAFSFSASPNRWLVAVDTSSVMTMTIQSSGQRLPDYNQHSIHSFTDNNEYHDLRAPIFAKPIPLDELINTGTDPECRSTETFNFTLYPSFHPPRRSVENINPLQKIPKIIHITAKSRCLTAKVRSNLLFWEALPGYSIYFHDDAAVDRLLSKYWPHFPHLSWAQQCSISGAAKADIWRYLVLWEYGGLYTGKFYEETVARATRFTMVGTYQWLHVEFLTFCLDIDNAPGRLFDKGRVISEEDQAWFVVERVGVLSQYFMAGIPRHPFFFVALTTCLSRLISMVEEIGTQYVPYITGPGVTKVAMMIYMKDAVNFQTVTEGTYTGLEGSTLTVKGRKTRSQQYIKRESIPKKNLEFKAMDMKHFTWSKNTTFQDSCYEHLYKRAIQIKQEK
jgi:mannosyltransferase OCH1-like enzyme